MNTLKIKDIFIEYKIIHKRIKNTYYRYKDNVLVITCPYLVSNNLVIDSIYKNEEQFYKYITKSSNNKSKDIFKLNDNMNIRLIEKAYIVRYSFSAFINDDIIYLDENKLYESFYKILEQILKQYCLEKVNYYYTIMYKDNNVPSLLFKNIKTYHGQYNIKKHQITLNIALAFLNKECIDEVIIHELCHIKYMNHSSMFHTLLDKYCPNNKLIRKKINKEWINLC